MKIQMQKNQASNLFIQAQGMKIRKVNIEPIFAGKIIISWKKLCSAEESSSFNEVWVGGVEHYFTS